MVVIVAPVVEGAVAGLAYGFLVGYIKYAGLWKKVIKSKKELTMGALYLHMGIGYAVNVVALLFVFLLRNIMPFNFMAAIIATAVGLSLSGKLAPIGEIMEHVKEKKQSC